MKRFALVAGAAALVAAGSTHASLFTNPSILDDRVGFDPAEVVSFNGAAGGAFQSPLGQNLGLALAPAGTMAELNPAIRSFGDNGYWSLGQTFVALLDATTGTLSFDFGGQTVAAVGALFNYYSGMDALSPTVTISAFGAGGNLLETRTLSFSFGAPDDYNLGVFAGFQRNLPEIARFTVSGDSVGVDFVGFTTAVPEPSTYAMLLAGLGLLGFAARRARRGA
jgi:hypothetical protein